MRSTVVLFFLVTLQSFAQGDRSVDTSFMGSAFSFTAIAETDSIALKAIHAAMDEVDRIESLISSWDISSETSNINRNAGVAPVHVSIELYQLIERSKRISVLSNGYFDISFASIDKVWDFKAEYVTVPDSLSIAASVAKINYRDILLNPEDTTVFLKNKGMKIGFGAIGKGYAAERAKQVMLEKGAVSGVVNAGGDLLAWGAKPNDQDWKVGIQDPNDKQNILMWIPVHNTAVVTSGNYERYVEINGEKYCHIINPKTGWPAKNLQSVTVVCPNAELADALATTIFVLGVEDGLALVNKLEGIECIIIDENKNLHFSDHIKSNVFIR